jgi:AcrR family transcriptional regulator
MHMKRQEGDRRAERTRRALRKALVELILEKRYDAITVQNVIDRANVGRSTFYAHFRDKEDLFLSDWEGLLEAFVRGSDWQNTTGGRIVPVKELFTHVQEFHHFYKALVRSRKTSWLFKTGQSYLTKSIEDALTALLADKPQTAVPLPILSSYLASGIMTLLRWWLDHNMPYPPERMDEIFHQLVIPGFQSVLGTTTPPAR